MQTVWNGDGIPAMNMIWTEVFRPYSLSILLSATPGVVTRLVLDPTTHGLCLWTPTFRLWYAIDSDPGPIPGHATGTFVETSAFRPGGILMPGQWQTLALPQDGLSHDLRCVAEDMSPVLYLTALQEIAP